jgi:L-proline amide hydrolase
MFLRERIMLRKKGLKAIKWTLLSATGLLLLFLFFPTWTPSIAGENSITRFEKVKINGAEHQIMIRGMDRNNPVLLFVHGGPGASEIPYVRKYQREWEKEYTIVHYDQRGSGKSYHFGEDYSDLTTGVLVDDLLSLTDYVAEELGQSKVLLAGHSFGTYIGIKAAAKAPEKFRAYIGIGQVSDTVESELDGLNYAILQAQAEGNTKDANKLEGMRESIETGGVFVPRNLIRKYGGASRLINDNKDYYTGFLTSTEYNGLDVIRYLLGVKETQDQLLKEETEYPLPSLVKQLQLPVYFVMGQYDYMTSAKAAEHYFDELQAPKKEFVLFEDSAHFPQFEEKERFLYWLNETFRDLDLHE